MSFLFKGGGPSSAEKIQAVETELEMVSDMFNRYFPVHLWTWDTMLIYPSPCIG